MVAEAGGQTGTDVGIGTRGYAWSGPVVDLSVLAFADSVPVGVSVRYQRLTYDVLDSGPATASMWHLEVFSGYAFKRGTVFEHGPRFGIGVVQIVDVSPTMASRLPDANRISVAVFEALYNFSYALLPRLSLTIDVGAWVGIGYLRYEGIGLVGARYSIF